MSGTVPPAPRAPAPARPKLGFGQAFAFVGIVAGALLTVAMVMQFDRPPIDPQQGGYRGTAMQTNYNLRQVAAYLADNKVPPSLPSLGTAGPKAGVVYKNVQVLGDVSVGEFTRLMVSITNWVAPQAGCSYCHNTANMAEDSKYTKVVARRMLQMVQHVNADWQPHVAATGVTCYTCHRGQPVPSQVWFDDPGPPHRGGAAETDSGMGFANKVNDSALPNDSYAPFLQQAANIRVQSEQALAGTDRHSIKETEWTYSLMMNMSEALGVNCTYCHNSRAFGQWDQSTPQRVTAWHGIRMVRDLNTAYLDPLNKVFPPARLGPLGDTAKVTCATCHQGVNKPLFGVSMVQAFPELQHPTVLAATAPAVTAPPGAPAAVPPAAPATPGAAPQ